MVWAEERTRWRGRAETKNEQLREKDVVGEKKKSTAIFFLRKVRFQLLLSAPMKSRRDGQGMKPQETSEDQGETPLVEEGDETRGEDERKNKGRRGGESCRSYLQLADIQIYSRSTSKL